MDLETLKATHPAHFRRAAALRMLAADAVEAARSGHPGMPLGMADVATVLFEKHLKFDAAAPDWPDRDRFVLSAGHGSMLLYGLLHLTGYAEMTLDELRRFRQMGSRTAGHPEYGHAPGVETTTGPLGQGLASAVGMAIAEEMLRARFSKRLVDHHTFVIAGDGCLMEGISHEAIGLAGRQKLSRLIVLWDDNGISIDGAVSLSDITDQKKRFAAAGWQVLACDGHDPDDIDRALTRARVATRPSLIACKTHIGFGAPTRQDSAAAHGAPLGAAEIDALRAAYGWPHPPFEIPDDIGAEWAAIGARGAEAHQAWAARLEAAGKGRRAAFGRALESGLPPVAARAIKTLKRELADARPKEATRKSSETALRALLPAMPELVGGSADLTGSNNTRTADIEVFEPTNRRGRYIHYGIREHGMAAAMNGMAAHGGIRPYGGTFLVFADYARGAMRLSALMGLPVTYVLTHDSIGLGEDGPTHQPVEHLAMCRATPNTLVFRPADATETAEAWEMALSVTDSPSVLALSRQALPAVRGGFSGANLVARGGYVLAEAQAKRQAVLIATGSEVHLALVARDMLEAEGIGTRVVSMPCFELFARQDAEYRHKVLPRGAVRVGVEAGVRQGWDRWLLGEGGSEAKSAFVGMEGFGASAPAEALFAHFGITADAVAEAARRLL